MIWLLAFLAAGILLSAFFSGAETGFYRASRVRLVLDALGGHSVSRALLWLTNNPALFVATTLVGNNIANYMTSLAIVGITHQVYHGETYMAELIAPILFSPLIFVYGELLPKNLFYHAPNRLLRRSGPLFLLFAVLFAPIAAVLWSLGRLLQWIVGEAPERVQLTLARNELQRMLHAGQEAGILQPAQQALAQQMFAVAGQPITRFCTSPNRFVSVSIGDRKSDAMNLARRNRVWIVVVRDANTQEIQGYVRVVDLYLEDTETIETCQRFLEIPHTSTYSAALLSMQTEKAPVARVIDTDGTTTGLVLAKHLRDPLFRDAAM